MYDIKEHRGLPFEHDKYAYLHENTIYLPRWRYLLVTTNYDYSHALDLLADRVVQDVDRRLKEKNL